MAGDICAAVGLKNLVTGDTICTDKGADRARVHRLPEAGDRGCRRAEDQGRPGKDGHGAGQAGAGRSDLQACAPTSTNGQTIIAGMGELHLEIIVDRMMREYKVEANVGKPQVNYRETIRSNAEAEGKYIRQTGGSGNYGHAKIRISPNEPGKGYEFSNDTKGGTIPKEYIKPIDQGIQEAMAGGVLAGYEMVDIKVSLYDGSYHDVDSNEMAFKIAGSMAFKEAARKAKPVLLEPVMAVEVTVPEDYMGTIIGDLNSRRGRIEGMEMVGDMQAIRATVPLSHHVRLCDAHARSRRRAARTTRCSSSSTKKRRGRFRKRSSPRCRARTSTGKCQLRAGATEFEQAHARRFQQHEQCSNTEKSNGEGKI